MTPQAKIPDAVARASILARIAPAISYALPALGAAISALLFMGVMRGMRNAESAGMAAVLGGISEANLAILVSLYLAIVVGFIGVVVAAVRLFTPTTTSSPSGWFYLITGVIGLAPMLALWQGQSLLLEVLFDRTTGVAMVAEQITMLHFLTLGMAFVSTLTLVISTFVPLPRVFRAKRKWAPLVLLGIIEIAVIAMTVAYHLRTTWLYNQAQLY
jgi:hypothetical protein